MRIFHHVYCCGISSTLSSNHSLICFNLFSKTNPSVFLILDYYTKLINTSLVHQCFSRCVGFLCIYKFNKLMWNIFLCLLEFEGRQQLAGSKFENNNMVIINLGSFSTFVSQTHFSNLFHSCSDTSKFAILSSDKWYVWVSDVSEFNSLPPRNIYSNKI